MRMFFTRMPGTGWRSVEIRQRGQILQMVSMWCVVGFSVLQFLDTIYKSLKYFLRNICRGWSRGGSTGVGGGKYSWYWVCSSCYWFWGRDRDNQDWNIKTTVETILQLLPAICSSRIEFVTQIPVLTWEPSSFLQSSDWFKSQGIKYY